MHVKAEDSVYFMRLMRNCCQMCEHSSIFLSLHMLEINSRVRWFVGSFVGWFIHSTARPRSPAQHLCSIGPAGGDRFMTGVAEMIIKLSFISRKFARRCFKPTTTARSHRESVRLPPLPVFHTFSNLQDLRVTLQLLIDFLSYISPQHRGRRRRQRFRNFKLLSYFPFVLQLCCCCGDADLLSAGIFKEWTEI